MPRGRNPDVERWRQVAELIDRGLTQQEVATRLGVSRQAVCSGLKTLGRFARRGVACAGCGGWIASPAAGPQDEGVALCLPCLARRPDATFAQRLKALRLAAGLSLAQLARAVGLAETTVGAYERRQRRVRPDVVRRVARALGFPFAQLDPKADEEGAAGRGGERAQ